MDYEDRINSVLKKIADDKANRPLTKLEQKKLQAAEHKKVIIIYPDMKTEVVKNITEASKITGVKHTLISRCCHGKHKQSAGYRFAFLVERN